MAEAYLDHCVGIEKHTGHVLENMAVINNKLVLYMSSTLTGTGPNIVQSWDESMNC